MERATVSHELRTPLNAVLGWTLTLLRRKPPPETERALDIIQRNARAQARLIDDVLDVSRIISGKLTLKLGPVDLRDAVHHAVDGVRPAADAKGITLVTELLEDEAAMTIIADGDRLQQILWNLLNNAVKFTGKNGTVEIRAGRVGSVVSLEVSDTGEGIRADVLPVIFDLQVPPAVRDQTRSGTPTPGATAALS